MNLKNGMATAIVALAALCQPVFAGGAPAGSVAKGCDEINRGNYTSAISILSAAIRQNPSDLDARRYLSSALIGAGMAREAAQQLEAIAKVAPGNAADCTMMAEAYNQMGDNKIATARYKQAILLDPAASAPRLGLARLFMASGDLNGAISLCNESLKTRRDAQSRQQFIDLLGTIRARSGITHRQLNG